MVLENTDSFAKKANPLGQESPYQDWEIVGEDLVNYEDKDARGLEFVFSVFRNNANSAMQKVVSVYQKPSDDQTGAFVIVSQAVDNPNDVRVYEISNTAYGNEPEDPQTFLRKVIEMADDSGMLREVSDYGSYGMLVETAEDGRTTRTDLPLGHATSTVAASASKNAPDFNSMRSKAQRQPLGSAAQMNKLQPSPKTKTRLEGNTTGISTNLQKQAQSTPGGFTIGVPDSKTASLDKQHYSQLDSDKKQDLAAIIHQGVRQDIVQSKRSNTILDYAKQNIDPKKKVNFESPIDKVQKSTADQLKDTAPKDNTKTDSFGKKEDPIAIKSNPYKRPDPEDNAKYPEKEPEEQKYMDVNEIKAKAAANPGGPGDGPKRPDPIKDPGQVDKVKSNQLGNALLGMAKGALKGFRNQLMGTTQGQITDGGAILTAAGKGAAKGVSDGKKQADKQTAINQKESDKNYKAQQKQQDIEFKDAEKTHKEKVKAFEKDMKGKLTEKDIANYEGKKIALEKSRLAFEDKYGPQSIEKANKADAELKAEAKKASSKPAKEKPKKSLEEREKDNKLKKYNLKKKELEAHIDNHNKTGKWE